MYKAVVLGVSAGGMKALEILFKHLKSGFKLPIIIVQHTSPASKNYLVKFLQKFTELNVKEAAEKEKILAGNVYIAPPNYHLLVELDETLSLTVEEKVSFARPSIDVLFETASDCYKYKLIGVVLTGANSDGAKGSVKIKRNGGYIIVQDPLSAEVESMPESVIRATSVDYKGDLIGIAKKLGELGEKEWQI